MFYKLRERVGRALHPFKSIADSLAKIATLYELEMAERQDAKGNPAPIRLVTEAPSRTDTVVTYTGVEEKPDPFEDVENWEEGV